MLRCVISVSAKGKWHWQINGDHGPIVRSSEFEYLEECLVQARRHSYGARIDSDEARLAARARPWQPDFPRSR